MLGGASTFYDGSVLRNVPEYLGDRIRARGELIPLGYSWTFAVTVDATMAIIVVVATLQRPYADLGMCLHEHAGLRSVDAGVEGALGVDDMPLVVERGCVLAEVPDVAAAVLGVVVRSLVRSSSALSRYSRSSTTRVFTPSMTRVRVVTARMSSACLPSLVPLEMEVLPASGERTGCRHQR